MSKKTKKIINFIIKLIVIIFFGKLLKKFTLYLNSQNILDLTLIKNTGAAFSFLNDNTFSLIIISLILLGFIFYYIYKNISKFDKTNFTAFLFLTSGAILNLSERIMYGRVDDFIKLPLVNFPVFNYYDLMITFGVFLLILKILKK